MTKPRIQAIFRDFFATDTQGGRAWDGCHAVGEAGATLVEADEARKGRKAAEIMSPARLFPLIFDV